MKNDFEQHPPIPKNYWVQLLEKRTENNENMILRVEFEEGQKLPPTIPLFSGKELFKTLQDDGNFPDIKEGDGIYACYIDQDIEVLFKNVEENRAHIKKLGGINQFVGHVGQFISLDKIRYFDIEKFRQYIETPIDPLALIPPADCGVSIKKENSLFITDLSVVEDPARTFNIVTQQGNRLGAWTFGQMIKNMSPQTIDGAKEFLKQWLKTWTKDQIVNGQTVKSRDFVFDLLIIPWIQRANGNASYAVDTGNWEAQWDAQLESALLINAPFKLTTIVNRLDLRGNAAYNMRMNNFGETRFIFTLISPYGEQALSLPTSPGSPPHHPNSSNVNISRRLIDWTGMNVIFEYGNSTKNKCELVDLSQDWLNLSDLSLGSIAYNDALEAITNKVTALNSSSNKPNGSAINRIRTNEKCFANVGPMADERKWELPDWEFRQFEINSTSGLLNMVPLTNSPPLYTNVAPSIDEDHSANTQFPANKDLLDWIKRGNKSSVKNGNHNLPATYLSGSGLVRREASQFFNFSSTDAATSLYNATDLDATTALEVKALRNQISLNTCQGCHAGETKTRFTHVNPVAYGESTEYWDNTNAPAGRESLTSNLGGFDYGLDFAFYPFSRSNTQSGINGADDGLNIGFTYDPILGNEINNFTSKNEIANQHFTQYVSPFLTGRRFSKLYNLSSQITTDSWADDNLDEDEDGQKDIAQSGREKFDQNLDQFFYVNDPSNDYNGGPQSIIQMDKTIQSKKYGYNDLERRKNDLCGMLNDGCIDNSNNARKGNQLNTVLQMIRFIPLPLGGH